MSLPPLIQYEAPFPLYGLGFSNSLQHSHRAALTSIITGPSNKLSVVDLIPSAGPSHSNSPPRKEYQQLASINLPFPATKVAFEPSTIGGLGGEDGGRGELLATSGDVLRLWELGMDWSGGEERGRGGYVGRNGFQGGMGGQAYNLSTRSVLTNSKTPTLSLPPITSFAWNTLSPERIVACSIDTTATLWNIETNQAVTQLIAHDRAVYDLSWLPESSDIFVSVGADGSLRAFDLRQLEHSTILYESVNESPLARIAFSNREQHMLACFGEDDSKVLILDMRSPGQPVAELVGHQGPLNAISWGSGGDVLGTTAGGWIASCADDGQLLLYDLTSPLPPSRPSSVRPSTKPRHRGSNSTNTNNSNSGTGGAKSSAYLGSNSLLPGSPLSPTRTPSPSASISAASSIDILPARAWDAGSEVNNLAFLASGEGIGCVSGSRLSVLRC